MQRSVKLIHMEHSRFRSQDLLANIEHIPAHDSRLVEGGVDQDPTGGAVSVSVYVLSLMGEISQQTFFKKSGQLCD